MLGAFALSGCSNFEEMNVNKNALQSSNATSFVQPITFGFEYALLNRSFDVNSQLMQYTVQGQTSAERIYNYRFNNSIVNYLWQNGYRWAGNCLRPCVRRPRRTATGRVWPFPTF